MKPFHVIAVPHRDILEGKLELNIFAANLCKVYKGEAPSEYQDKDEFFRKTFLTKGLQNLLDVVQKRLDGKGGDPVIQLQTPFGGGKTHSLIAIYHKAKEWGAKAAVIEGTALSGDTKLWELLEEQLTGSTELLKGDTSPGRDKIEKVLRENQPILILIDELLEYITKAAGIKIVDTTLAAQTIAFLQELTEAASLLDKTTIIITLPSSIIEHYDESAERLFQQLQKVSGRIERIYTPVEEAEITQVIRKRLFSNVDEEQMKNIVYEVVDYFKNENIIPPRMEISEYRKLFENSYPFLPEVVEVLYERWGSFPTFQRTRGVLRLLSLVVFDVKDKNIPYISLADFNLSNYEIKGELTKHIGSQYDSVIASDITSENAGAKKVDSNLGDTYKGLRLGTRTATSIFMYSFSGGVEKGATKNEIKRIATTVNNPSSIVGEALDELRNSLFYLQHENEKYFFANQPNLNRIVVTRMENLSDDEVKERERDVLEELINSAGLRTYIWIERSYDIPDTTEFKLVILKNTDKKLMEELISYKGNSPRVNRNNIFFLTPMETYRNELSKTLRKMVALEDILKDETLNFSQSQVQIVKDDLKKIKNEYRDLFRNCYRLLYIPLKSDFKEEDLGPPIYGDSRKLNDEVFEFLVNRQEILRSVSPIVIQTKVLSQRDYVRINDLYTASLTTRGEMRFFSIDTILNSVKEGVKLGIFGVGIEKDGKYECKAINEKIEDLSEDYLIVKKELCQEIHKASGESEDIFYKPTSTVESKFVLSESDGEQSSNTTNTNIRDTIELSFTLPKGKALEIGRMINFIDSKFKNIQISIKAKDGSISEEEYKRSIEELLRQIGIMK